MEKIAAIWVYEIKKEAEAIDEFQEKWYIATED